MLQIRSPDPLARLSNSRSTAVSPGDLLASLSSLARRRFGIIVLIFSLSVMCGAVYLFTAPPKFLAQASLIIDTRKTQLFQQQSVVGDVTIDFGGRRQPDRGAEVGSHRGVGRQAASSDQRPGICRIQARNIWNYAGISGADRADVRDRSSAKGASAFFAPGSSPSGLGATYVIEIGYLSLSPLAPLKSPMRPRTPISMISSRPNIRRREGRVSGCRRESRSSGSRHRRRNGPCWISRRRTTSLTPAAA